MPLYGPKWPLKSGNEDAFALYDNVEEQISFYLKNLMLTSPGENLSDPSYGVGLRRFLFEPNIDSYRSSILSAISSQISIYLSFLDVSDVEVIANAQDIDSNSITIKVVYAIPGDVIQKIFELDLQPESTIGFY